MRQDNVKLDFVNGAWVAHASCQCAPDLWFQVFAVAPDEVNGDLPPVVRAMLIKYDIMRRGEDALPHVIYKSDAEREFAWQQERLREIWDNAENALHSPTFYDDLYTLEFIGAAKKQIADRIGLRELQGQRGNGVEAVVAMLQVAGEFAQKIGHHDEYQSNGGKVVTRWLVWEAARSAHYLPHYHRGRFTDSAQAADQRLLTKIGELATELGDDAVTDVASRREGGKTLGGVSLYAQVLRLAEQSPHGTEEDGYTLDEKVRRLGILNDVAKEFLKACQTMIETPFVCPRCGGAVTATVW
jgi:hypothetical protein